MSTDETDRPEGEPDAATPATSTEGDGPGKGERIAKVLARAGVASRRDCERLIVEGRVRLNGAVVASPAVNVMPSDRLAVDGRPVAEAEATRLWLYHKPAGLVTTERDEEGRPTVFDSLPEDLPRVMSVGRLDITSEGLLILTNDGEVKRRLELPSTGWLRRYRVRINGALSEAQLDELRAGITVDGFDYEPMEVEFDRQQGANAWLTVALREGKNREIRRVMEHLGVQVSRLIRVSYGPFQLGNLEPGAVEEVRPKVVRDQLGHGASAPAARRARRKGEAPDPGPVTVETPRRAALATRLPAGAGAVKRSLKLRAVKVRDADASGGKSGSPRRAPKAVPTRQVMGAPAGPMGPRRNRTFMRKDGPRPVTETTEEQAREVARAARAAAREAEASGSRPRSRPDDRGERPARPLGDRPARPAGPRREGNEERPRSAGFKSHPRPPREGGEERPRSGGFRSHSGPAEGNDRPRARSPRGEGADAKGPRTAGRPDKAGRPARFERPAEGERPVRRFGTRAEGDTVRARPARDGDRPVRQDRSDGPRSGPRTGPASGAPSGSKAGPRSDHRSGPRSGPASSRADASSGPPRGEAGRPARSGPGGPRPESGPRGPRTTSPRSDGPRTDAPRGDRPRAEGAPPAGPRGAGGPRGGKPAGGPRKGPPRGGAPSGRKPRKD